MSDKFTIELKGIDYALELLGKAENLEQPMMAACRELIETAEKIVTARYSISYASQNGNKDFTTTIEPIENGYRLIASGEDVGFLEFGAGVFTEADDFESQVSFPVYPGSWSELHPHSDNPNARYFAKNGFWWWSNFRYTGLIATRGMQRALDEIRMQADEVVRKKINEWLGN